MIPLVSYNIFILLLCVLVSLFTARIIFKKAKKDKESIAFARYLLFIPHFVFSRDFDDLSSLHQRRGGEEI